MSEQPTLFWYDLETSGRNPRYDRTMQFAGVRTTADFVQIGKPVNLKIKLSEDTLPSPEAVLVNKITPQDTRDGLTEAEFAKIAQDEIFTPNTTAIGFNNIRFDDEFMRHTFWRNFIDSYTWQWQDGRGKWDLLDVVRAVRALRPEGINWPTQEKEIEQDGKKQKIQVSANKLELLTKENKLEHANAHDALSDVLATIAVAKMLKTKQPKIYNYLWQNRGKNAVKQLVNLENPVPFVYVSGRFSAEHEKLAVCYPIAPGKNSSTVLVYNLHQDPDEHKNYTITQLTEAICAKTAELEEKKLVRPALKELNYGRCPAVAPYATLRDEDAKRLGIDKAKIEENIQKLLKNEDLVAKLTEAWNQRPEYPAEKDVEGQLYDAFLPDSDRAKVAQIPQMSAEQLADFHPNFTDERLPELLWRYKARNFPSSLSEKEAKRWQEYRKAKFAREIKPYMAKLAQLQQAGKDEQILQELQSWAEQTCPDPEEYV